MRVFVDTSIIPVFLAGQDDRIQEIVRRVETQDHWLYQPLGG